MDSTDKNIFTEWLVVPFTTSEVTIGFNKAYRSKPSVFVQVYGDANSKTKVVVQSHVTDGIRTYGGVTITATGTGTDLAIQIIGRV